MLRGKRDLLLLTASMMTASSCSKPFILLCVTAPSCVCRILYINCCQILWSAYLSNLSAGGRKNCLIWRVV